jgi:hypothetical protein
MNQKSSLAVWRAIVLLLVATCGVALAQQEEQLDLGVGVQSASCFSTHTSGSGTTFVKVCFSNHGNLVQFESPAGFEHIRVGSFGEGYVVCSGTTAHGFDAGSTEAGFGAPTISQPNGANTFPLTITRTTTNGVFQLRQTFAWDTTEKDVTITMTLTNRSSRHAARPRSFS